MKIEELLKDQLSQIKRKDVRLNLIKITELMLRLDYKKNNKKSTSKYFDAPSALLEKINIRYKKYITILLESKIIDYYSTEEDNVLFHMTNYEQNKKVSYSNKLHQSIKYIFLIDTSDIEFNKEYECTDNWYVTTTNSLTTIGLCNKISRCTYGRRVHTKITAKTGIDLEGIEINSYKEYFKTGILKDKYSVVDLAQSQPTILYNIMKNGGYIDDNLFSIIENGDDIYNFIQDNLNLSDNDIEGRKLAKKLFQRFISKKDKSPEIRAMQAMFSGINHYVNVCNKNDHKRTNQLLQRFESSLIIDDIFNKLNYDFCLTVHDSFIVENQFADELCNKLNKKYNNKFLTFKIEKL